ncbi:winged helix-turn-helix domain-containing protein [Vibrio celticus]|uniref:Transcriptional activator CadC n=1 Tax=Vibrio celticus TaxID=446372 RepID=A0A1C3JI97_9VIBR|nr:winged helix-turn-helix domain-containing protein [Vibrio celticus]SBT14926.1 Transcriptional activator CadC [Vibrio celticus]
MVKLYLEPPIYKVGELYYSPTSAVIDNQGERSRLRAREANLFHELIKTFPEVLSRSLIEETLWKDSYATNATINQTVKALRFSLEDVDRTMIRTIPKLGYVLAVAPQLEESIAQQTPDDSNTSEPQADKQQAIEKAKVDDENTEQQKASIPQNIIPSVSALLAVAIATFAQAASGVFTASNERISHQYGNHWILFNATEQELKSLPLKGYDPAMYVIKHESSYRTCTEVKGVLECKKIEF